MSAASVKRDVRLRTLRLLLHPLPLSPTVPAPTPSLARIENAAQTVTRALVTLSVSTSKSQHLLRDESMGKA